MSTPSALATFSKSSTAGTNDIRVMIVDDSAVVRGLVGRWVEQEPGMTAVARHANGQLALSDITASKPDIVILDIEMPVMDGLTALPLLLKAYPKTKVIMASTLTHRNAVISMKALSLGATDYVPKPESNSGVSTSADFQKDLIRKIKAIAGRTVSSAKPRYQVEKNATHPFQQQKTSAASQPIGATGKSLSENGLSKPATNHKLRPISKKPPRILAIGSSTGGPQALMDILKSIAPALRAIPVVITQHMPPTFTTILSQHLGEATGMPSKEGEDGDALSPGSIYLAPGGKHMVLEPSGLGAVIRLHDGPAVNFCKPAVDPLFDSVAKIYGASALGVILTGMGHDGAKGATAIADAGGTILAQDQETSVVWGMPGAAAAAGACSAILPLVGIGKKISELTRATR